MARPVPGSIIELNNSFDEWRQSYNLTRREVFQGTNEAEPNTIVFRDEEGGFKANNLELLTITVGDDTHNVRIDPSVATSNGLVRFNTPFGIQIPVGETNQRPNGQDEGVIRYNTTISSFEGYSSSAGAFVSLGGVVSVDQATFAVASDDAGIGFYIDSFKRTHNADVGTDDSFNDKMHWRIDPNGTFLPGDTQAVNIGSPTAEVNEIYTNELHISGVVTQSEDGITFGDRLHIVDRDLLLGVVSDGANNGAAFTGTTDDLNSVPGGPHAFWVATINTAADSINVGLYKENGVGVWTIVNDDGTFGVNVLSVADVLEYYGPQLDTAISDAGLIVPGFERAHKWVWDSATEAWVTNETIVIENVTAIKIPVGDENQRPGGTNDGSNLDAQSGMIRFNTDTTSFEGCIGTPVSGAIWAGLGGVVDSADDGDTFLSVYGAANPNDIGPDSDGDLNQMRFFTKDVERIRVDEDTFDIRSGNTDVHLSVDSATGTTLIVGAKPLHFRNVNSSINSPTNGALSISAAAALNLTAPTMDISGGTTIDLVTQTLSINTAGSAGTSHQILRKNAGNTNVEWVGFGVFASDGITRLF